MGIFRIQRGLELKGEEDFPGGGGFDPRGSYAMCMDSSRGKNIVPWTQLIYIYLFIDQEDKGGARCEEAAGGASHPGDCPLTFC